MRKILKEYLFFLEFKENKKYNTIISIKNDLEKFLAYFEEKNILSLNDITFFMLKEYCLNMKVSSISGSTYNRNLSSIKKFFKYLKEKSLVKENIAVLLENEKLEDNEIDFLKPDEISKIRETFQQKEKNYSNLRDELLFELLYSSGITIGELLSLSEININLDEREIYLLKSSKRKILFFSNRVKEIYLRFKKIKEEKFGSNNNNLIFLNNSAKKLTDRSVRRIIEKCGIESKIEKNINPYMIRHTFCVNLLKAGMPREYLKKLLDITATDIFDKYEKIIKKENLWPQKIV